MGEMTMVERVARALAVEAGGYADDWRGQERTARIALLAMREPTEAMVRKTGIGVSCDCDYLETLGAQECVEDWQTMVDAALAEEPRPCG